MTANLETWLAEENSIIQKADNEKQVYLYEWLDQLNEHLITGSISNAEIKAIQPKIVSTLHKILEINCSPATRQQLARCFATIYNVGTTLGLFESVNKCLEIIKSRDDSSTYLAIKLSAICCTGGIYERLGRMVGTLFDVGLQSLVKMLYKTEVQAKCEILLCIQKMLFGLQNAASNGFKDIYKACKACLVDKSMVVRWASAKCALELSKHASFMCTTDLETMVSVCLKSLEASNYDVRVQVSQLLGVLMSGSQNPPQINVGKTRKISIEDMFSLMAAGFLKGGIGFLKSGESNSSREMRVGVTQAYVAFFHEMGVKWVTKYLSGVIAHVLELAASQRNTTSHIDAVYSRKCVSFILHSVFSGMLPERIQVQAVKELCKIISKQMNSIHDIITSAQNSETAVNMDVISTQHVLVCALQELGNLVVGLTSSLKSNLSEIFDAVFSTLIHPAPSVWLSAAWCIRCCAKALPSNITSLIDTCLKKINTLKSSPEAVTGYGYTLAAIIGGLHSCPLGIPYSKARSIFLLATNLLESGGKAGRLLMAKLQTGWVLLGALCTLGSSFVKSCLPKMIQLWSSAFPEGNDVEAEKGRGSLKTWQRTMENRAGVLCSLASFIEHCKDILVPDVLRKIMVPIEAALSSIPLFPMLLKIHGGQLQISIAVFKARLYQLLVMLQPTLFEGSFTPLLRDLVGEFTMADRKGAVTTSMLQQLCHKDDSILLGSWLQDTDHRDVEEQLQVNSASGSGALEHDSSCIYGTFKDNEMPGPLPLGVTVIDTAITLFGHIFSCVSNKHRGQLMSHFNECISKNKGVRQQAIQTNIFTAFLAALKNLAENKSMFGEEAVRTHANTLVQDALANTDNILRCAAGEALGRMAQVMNDTNFVAQMAQKSFEKCQKTPDAVIRTGHALALGCLHRYVGGMGSGHHLTNSVSILTALSKDASSSLVQMWSLHGLTLIADSGGPMFRSYVDQTFYSVVNLLLQTPPSMTEVHQCLGKCVGALITAIGPELQDLSKKMERSRMFCMVAYSIMQNHPDSLVQAEAIRCLQQLHVFAPNVVNLNTLIPNLCSKLLSPHLLLRKASVDCLRQLAHREANEICELGKSIVDNNEDVVKKMYISNRGLEGLLFSLLDAEVDSRLLKHIRETIISMLQALADKDLKHWLGLCKQVLLASNNDEENAEQIGGEDDEEGAVVLSQKRDDKPVITPKWPTRVFAMECIRMILDVCKKHNKHTDLALARKCKEENSSVEYLVMQLTELVRMAFISGTSPNDLLKLEGMKTLQDVVMLFAKVPDPDISGHLILEQFQAQVGTALRPAFADNIPPDVTAMACEVCSSWIGCGISRDINDVRRIQQLLVNSLEKIGSNDKTIRKEYSESAYTLETLAVLKAWAQIYIMAFRHGQEQSTRPSEEDVSVASGNLLDVVIKDLDVLVKHWIGVARDYVLLSLPVQYSPQLPPDGGSFYSGETTVKVRPHYKQSWPPMVHAVALWLTSVAFNDPDKAIIGAIDEAPAKMTIDSPAEKSAHDINRDRFHLIFGICVEAMCSPLSTYPEGTTESCINTISSLLESQFGRSRLVSSKELCIELLTVLHRLLLSNDDMSTQQTILHIVAQCALAFQEKIYNDNDDDDDDGEERANHHAEGEIAAKKSVVFSLLEICTFMVSKYAGDVVSAAASNTGNVARKMVFSGSSMDLLTTISSILSTVPNLCTPTSSLLCLPTVMFLTSATFKYISMNLNGAFQEKHELKTALAKLCKSFKVIITCKHASCGESSDGWSKMIQSTMLCILQSLETCSSYEGVTDPSSAVLILWENILLILSVFLLQSPPQTISSTHLLNDAIEIFVSVIQQAPPKLRLSTIKYVESMIKSSDEEISHPFIVACIPEMVALLEKGTTTKISTEAELLVYKECVSIVELILAKVQKENLPEMMNVYITALVSLLHDSTTLGKANSFSRSLHEYCIQRLTATGPLYPDAFRQCMSNAPHLKERLTNGIKANSAIRTRTLSGSGGSKSSTAQPQIKLKMDFSNFK